MLLNNYTSNGVKLDFFLQSSPESFRGQSSVNELPTADCGLPTTERSPSIRISFSHMDSSIFKMYQFIPFLVLYRYLRITIYGLRTATTTNAYFFKIFLAILSKSIPSKFPELINKRFLLFHFISNKS